MVSSAASGAPTVAPIITSRPFERIFHERSIEPRNCVPRAGGRSRQPPRRTLNSVETNLVNLERPSAFRLEDDSPARSTWNALSSTRLPAMLSKRSNEQQANSRYCSSLCGSMLARSRLRARPPMRSLESRSQARSLYMDGTSRRSKPRLRSAANSCASCFATHVPRQGIRSAAHQNGRSTEVANAAEGVGASLRARAPLQRQETESRASRGVKPALREAVPDAGQQRFRSRWKPRTEYRHHLS